MLTHEFFSLDTAPAAEFTIYNGGTTQSQIYVGPTDFTIDTA